MLTFHQFLISEAFLKGVKGSYGYTELWKNPSKSEIADLARETTQLAGFVVGKDFYLWNRDNAAHHDVEHDVPTTKSGIPLYLSVDPKTLTAYVRVSSYTMEKRGAYDYNEASIVAKLRKHPAFTKVFPTIRLDK